MTKKKGLLCFYDHGKEEGWGDGGLFAKLKGALDLTSGNLEFI